MDHKTISELLEGRGLRTTRPRIAVCELLFDDGIDRHVTAEWVAEQLAARGHKVALATVYNTLHSFSEAGILRHMSGLGDGVNVFDTNLGAHHHFYDEATGTLTDIPAEAIKLEDLPDLPDGKSLVAAELIIRVR